MVIQAVLFDLGNTLTAVTSLAESLAGLASSQLATRLRLDRWQLLQIGQVIEEYIDSLYQEQTPSQPHWLDVWQQAAKDCNISLTTHETEHLGYAHLKAFAADCSLQPYSLPLLAFLRRAHIPLGLVSNLTGPVEVFDTDLVNKGIASFFQVVAWSSAIGYRKPDSRIFQAAVDRLKLEPGRQIVMVGDSEPADIQGGQRLGFTTVKVVAEDEKTQSAADYVVTGNDLIELFRSRLRV